MIFSCNTINQPKPKGYLALNYPKSNYNQFLKQKFPFSFEYNNIAKVYCYISNYKETAKCNDYRYKRF